MPSKHSKLCSLHSHPSDFVSDRTDSNTARKKRKLAAASIQLLRRHLKPGAVPSIFQNAPSYLSTPKASSRKTTADDANDSLNPNLLTMMENRRRPVNITVVSRTRQSSGESLVAAALLRDAPTT